MKVICTSPSFAKYDQQPIKLLNDAGLELIMLPADAGLEDDCCQIHFLLSQHTLR